MQENLEYMDDDLSGIQEELFEEVSLEELTEIEDEYKEIKCAHCNKPVFVEASAIEENNNIRIYDIEKTGKAEIIKNKNTTTLTLITCRHNTNKQIVIICELV